MGATCSSTTCPMMSQIQTSTKCSLPLVLSSAQRSSSTRLRTWASASGSCPSKMPRQHKAPSRLWTVFRLEPKDWKFSWRGPRTATVHTSQGRALKLYVFLKKMATLLPSLQFFLLSCRWPHPLKSWVSLWKLGLRSYTADHVIVMWL